MYKYNQKVNTYDVAIIGAGIAGCSAAHFLSKENLKVCIIDSSVSPPVGGSNNPRAVLMPPISIKKAIRYQVLFQAFKASINHFEDLELEVGWDKCGVVKLDTSRQLRRICSGEAKEFYPKGYLQILDARSCSEVCGLEVNRPGIYISQGGVIDLVKLCKLYRESSESFFGEKVLRLSKQGGQWELKTKNRNVYAKNVVLACGAAANGLVSDWDAFLHPVRGQFVLVKPQETLRKLKKVLCFDGYITPLYEGRHLIGSTYDHNDFDLNPRVEDTQEILNKAGRVFVGDQKIGGVVSETVGFRVSTKDKLPIIGKIEEGLYTSLGHASHGSYSAPFAAMLIRDLLFENNLENYGFISEDSNQKSLIELISPI